MNKEQFLFKYGVHNSMTYHYKRMFPDCVINGELDYNLLDGIIQERTELKEYLKDKLVTCKATDLYPYFMTKGKNYRELANQWFTNLYIDYDKPKLISQKALDNFNGIKEYIDNGLIKIDKD